MRLALFSDADLKPGKVAACGQLDLQGLDGNTAIAAGADPMAMSRGVQKAVAVCLEQLGKMATPVKSNDKSAIATVATIAGNNDPEIGVILSDALLKVGNDGVITVEEGRQVTTEVDLVEGYPVTVNDANEAARFAQVCAATLGEKSHVTLPSPVMGGEGFSMLLQRVPGAMALDR